MNRLPRPALRKKYKALSQTMLKAAAGRRRKERNRTALRLTIDGTDIFAPFKIDSQNV